jgi:hypothetical protein
MLGQWRVVLRQAEESAKAGRFDEALALACRPGVADHRQALVFRSRLVRELVARAERRAKADDVAGAIVDLDLAEKSGAAPDVLAAARLGVADRVADEVRMVLDAGDPARALERIDELAKHCVSGPALRRCREAADAWRSAHEEARRGEFGLAQERLDRAERLAGESAAPALAAARRDLEARQKAAYPKVEAFYAALGKGVWPEVLGAAEAVLEAVPEHPAARQARSRAWQQIAAISPAAAPPQRIDRPEPLDLRTPRTPLVEPGIVFLDSHPTPTTRPAAWANSPRPQAPAEARCPLCRGPMAVRQGIHGNFLGCRAYPRCRGTAALATGADMLYIDDTTPSPRSARGPKGRFLLWADGVGGYLVCLEPELTIGRAGPEGDADIQVLGDISRRHVTLVRDGDGYVLKAHHTTFVNHKKAEVATLRDGDVVRLGPSVEFEFRQPSPVSTTARLRLISRHRLPLAVDGVVLMGDTCIIGPTPQSHLLATNQTTPVVLYRQGAGLWCRAAGSFEIDGQPAHSRGPLTMRSSVLGEGFSFSLEPLDSGPAAGPVA